MRERSHLVPETRIDRNGKSTIRWVKEGAVRGDKGTALPSPRPTQQEHSPKEEQRALYLELRAAVIADSNRGHGKGNNRQTNKNVLERLQLKKTEDQRDLYRLFRQYLSSGYNFLSIERAYAALKENGVERPSDYLADEANLEVAYSFGVVLSSLPDHECKQMIHHALTSGERELAERAVFLNKVASFDQLIDLMAVQRDIEAPLRSGAL